MAMLAEPRRKQKWSVDPRNSAWSKDESKFGQKMLERMGWSKGKGLGKSEQGGTEHIKVKVKNNNLGLGTAASHEDNWIAHQDDFNQLLADLNNCHGQSNPPAPQEQSFSLEEKSKTSKKRVHYMKFTKGKDLSSRSQTDLACIFGKRARRGTDQEEESSGQDSQEEREVVEAEAAVVTPDPEAEANTVTSSLTMQEYFAQRMSQLRGRRAPVTSPKTADLSPETADLSPETTPDIGATAPPDHAPDSPAAPKSKSKKKKKKKSKEREKEEEEEEQEVEVERVGVGVEVSVSQGAEQEGCGLGKKNKKKRRRKREDGGMEGEECGLSCGSRDGGVEEAPPEEPAGPALNGHTGKRRRREQEQEKPKKDKKKRKEK
ncbi:PIN2/TERF1-interacting telomerase inhibitor 1 [Conger conger]|uniref:PIN2/TERF1-interacting telomerase inhibitor 1 n=1 Tax=Conger conger TaxID=82655 RepID=UPI002A5B031D|nr:PIN2/TERF1-interacting telomerase inhibitor 1 [Conger conger]